MSFALFDDYCKGCQCYKQVQAFFPRVCSVLWPRWVTEQLRFALVGQRKQSCLHTWKVLSSPALRVVADVTAGCRNVAVSSGACTAVEPFVGGRRQAG